MGLTVFYSNRYSQLTRDAADLRKGLLENATFQVD